MSDTFIIRNEAPGDEAAIRRLTADAFAPMPFSDGSEPAIIDRLRAAGDLTLSLVAVEAGVIVGHVAFSPARVDSRHDHGSGGWFALGPIAVRADRQRQGIGSRLVAQGLERLRAMGAAGCVLVGNPAVYGPMGFESGALSFRDLDPRLVQHVVLAGPPARGEAGFAPGFGLD